MSGVLVKDDDKPHSRTLTEGLIRVERVACSGMWRWTALDWRNDIIDSGMCTTQKNAEAYATDAVHCRAKRIEKRILV